MLHEVTGDDDMNFKKYWSYGYKVEQARTSVYLRMFNIYQRNVK
jgi:hypothetical protein